MADISSAMGPERRVALDQECTNAIQKVEDFKQSVNGVISQIEGVINGLKSDYTGEGSVKFYEACQSNIEQMRTMVENICTAYAGPEGLFKSIENQILTANESLNKTLVSTNTKFNANTGTNTNSGSN